MNAIKEVECLIKIGEVKLGSWQHEDNLEEVEEVEEVELEEEDFVGNDRNKTEVFLIIIHASLRMKPKNIVKRVKILMNQMTNYARSKATYVKEVAAEAWIKVI